MCLILCLISQDQRGREVPPEAAPDSPGMWARNYVVPPCERDLVCQDLVGLLGLMPSAGIPAAFPWHSLCQIGRKDLFPLENILVYQPILFFQECLDKHDRDIQGYSALFCKQERVKNKLLQPERIAVQFREKPFSVHFHWQEGAGLARKVCYVEGENNGHMRVRPIIGWILAKDPEGAEAMRTSRFSIKQYGMKLALQRTVDSMLRAQTNGTLHVHYMGVYPVDKLGGRLCYKFVRTPYVPPEEDGLNELMFYIDKETGMQVGAELRDSTGQLLAEYYFRDVKTNPSYDPHQFTDKSL
jgi:Protein of unknown function (DUF1571)